MIASVDDYAFAYSAIASIDLTGTEYIGTYAFIKEKLTPFTVKLGEKLSDIGDNPFAMCKLAPFSSVKVTEFNGNNYEETSYNFDLSENITVIEGSLYRRVPNGLELITYAGEGKNAVVADETVRLSAMSFAGSDVRSVELPKELNAIGHKAFFGCESLTLVTFKSYDAPILEEEFDYNYYSTFENIPATGDYTFVDQNGGELIYSGLGIVDYFMWNAADAPYVIYYGANFIDYIGHIDNKITMVYPSNGKNYDSFVLGQYFDTVVLGAAAADDITLAAIALIDCLPETVSLDDRALVEQARAAYDAISNIVQRALVTNYQKLTEAEDRIQKLLTLDQPEDTEAPTDGEGEGGLDLTTTILIVLTSLLAVVVVTIIIIDSIHARREKKNADFEETVVIKKRGRSKPATPDKSDKEGEEKDENDKND